MKGDGAPGSAFLLTQLGTYAAQEFAKRVAELDLTPPQAGLLRAISLEPGRSQQALARHLGTPATRLVALVDGLEQRGLVERRRNPDDRRLYAVHPQGLEEASQWLSPFERFWRPRLDALGTELARGKRERRLAGERASAEPPPENPLTKEN